MKYDILKESDNIPKVAIIFGRFQPAHEGHVAAWEKTKQAGPDGWYVGTNPNTMGAKSKTGKGSENKDPLPYDLKALHMTTMMPELKSHLVPETSWMTLATLAYNHHGKCHLSVVCSEEEEYAYKLISKWNGQEGKHGYYNFASIDWVQPARSHRASDVRAAVYAGDRAKFAGYLGKGEDYKVQGKNFFDIMAHYLEVEGAEMKESSLGKIVREDKQWKFKKGTEVIVSHGKKQVRGVIARLSMGSPRGAWVTLKNGKEIFSSFDYLQRVDESLDEGYFQQSVDKVAKDWEHRRRTGKWPDETDEKNSLSHDRDGVHVSDKDLARRPLFTDEERKQRDIAFIKRQLADFERMNDPSRVDIESALRYKKRLEKLMGESLDEEQVNEAEGWVTGAKLVKKGGQLGLKFPKIGTVFGVGEMITYGDEDGYITGFSKNGTKVQVEIDREHGTKKYWWPIDGVEQHWDNRRLGEDSDPMNPTVGNYDLDTLQRKVARDFAQMAEEASKAKSRREWNNIMHQLSNNTMYQLEDILDTYETLQARYSKGGPNSRGIDKSRLESTSTLGQITQEDCGTKRKGKK